MDWSFYPAAGIFPVDSAGRARPENCAPIGSTSFQTPSRLSLFTSRAFGATSGLSRQDTRRLWRLLPWSTRGGTGP